MPKVACPGCQKVYKVPDTAAGQSATCKQCGRKFRIGKPPSPASQPKADFSASASKTKPKASTTATLRSQSTSASRPAATKVVAPKSEVSKPSDSFWDEALNEEYEVEAPTTSSSTNPAVASTLAEAKFRANKKSKKVVWGVKWDKVLAGLGMMVLGGGGAALMIFGLGRIRKLTVTLIIVAIAGLFTFITGLMGDEGIW